MSRKRPHDAAPSDGDLENWLRDLVGGETTARRFRERLRADGQATSSACAVCTDAAAGTRHEDHLAERCSA